MWGLSPHGGPREAHVGTKSPRVPSGRSLFFVLSFFRFCFCLRVFCVSCLFVRVLLRVFRVSSFRFFVFVACFSCFLVLRFVLLRVFCVFACLHAGFSFSCWRFRFVLFAFCLSVCCRFRAFVFALWFALLFSGYTSGRAGHT